MDNTELHSTVEVHTVQISQVERRQDKIDVVIEKIRNRPPLWCTFALAGLLGAIGWLVGN